MSESKRGYLGLLAGAVLCAAPAGWSAAAPAFADNLARGKPYTLSPRPNYRLCTDPGDATQLTDGVYTKGYFWTQKTTVGWRYAHPVVIAIDLGRDEPIRGASFRTAAGTAGVTWPSAILVFASLDGRRFHYLGDLVALSAQRPPAGRYAEHRFRTDRLRAHGRYVELLVLPSGPYTFADEIEIARGRASWLGEPLPGEPIRDPVAFARAKQVDAAARRRLREDAERVRRLAETAPREVRAEVDAALEGIAASIPRVETGEGFRAVLPINDLHARIFRLHARLLRARGLRGLTAWGGDPWDWIDPFEVPRDPPPPSIEILAARGAVRAGAVRLVWAGEGDVDLRIRFDGVPGGPAPAYLGVHRVAWTDTRQGVPVAAALPPAERTEGGYRIPLAAGLASQVWLRLRAEGIAPGRHAGHVVIAPGEGPPARIPIAIEIFPIPLPRGSLHLGGWDYTDGEGRYAVTEGNRDALVAHLRSRGVDAPWATSAVLPVGRYDGEGRLAEPPDTARLDAWLRLWPDARLYCVFASVGDRLASSPIGDPLFSREVGAWISFWVAHLRRKGIPPGRLALLLVDEPHERAQDERIVAWARAIRAAEPEVLIWEDPTYREPREALPALWEACDVLCPNRPMMLAAGAPFERFYRDLARRGKRLSLYACSGPTRLLDPYAYYRLQAWDCFRLGAEGSYFWAFADAGKGPSWNEYACGRTSYTPLYLDRTGVTPGKHMEAIFEGIEDFACLERLRLRIEALRGRAGAPAALLARAEALLRDAPDRVLGARGVRSLSWREPKDRTMADAVRREILRILAELAR